jgi:hypothetical protein
MGALGDRAAFRDSIGKELECANVQRYAIASMDTRISPMPEARGETLAERAKSTPDITAAAQMDIRSDRSHEGSLSCMESSMAEKNIIRHMSAVKKRAAAIQ